MLLVCHHQELSVMQSRATTGINPSFQTDKLIGSKDPNWLNLEPRTYYPLTAAPPINIWNLTLVLYEFCDMTRTS